MLRGFLFSNRLIPSDENIRRGVRAYAGHSGAVDIVEESRQGFGCQALIRGEFFQERVYQVSACDARIGNFRRGMMDLYIALMHGIEWGFLIPYGF